MRMNYLFLKNHRKKKFSSKEKWERCIVKFMIRNILICFYNVCFCRVSYLVSEVQIINDNWARISLRQELNRVDTAVTSGGNIYLKILTSIQVWPQKKKKSVTCTVLQMTRNEVVFQREIYLYLLVRMIYVRTFSEWFETECKFTCI